MKMIKHIDNFYRGSYETVYCLFLSVLLFSLISCSDQTDVNLEEEREQVMTLLDNFVKAHEEKDLICFFPVFPINLI